MAMRTAVGVEKVWLVGHKFGQFAGGVLSQPETMKARIRNKILTVFFIFFSFAGNNF